MSKDNVVLTYQGRLEPETISDLLKFTEHRLQEKAIDKATQKRIFMIMLESLQNSYKHGSEVKSEDENICTVALVRHSEDFELTLGNYLNEDASSGLEEKLQLIQQLSPEELKEKYREVLNNGQQSEIGGSGLGLMHIARKSGHSLDYKIDKVEDGVCYFTFNVKIKNG